MGLGHSHHYSLPEIVAFCLMFTSQDADVILKMELIFKKRFNNREGNKLWLSPSPRPTTVAAVPLHPYLARTCPLVSAMTGDGEMDQSLSKT